MAGYFTADATAPASKGTVLTLSDVTVIENTRGLYVGGTGALTVQMYGMPAGTTTLFSGIPAGTFMPIQVTKVFATGSTATLVIALY